MSPPTDRAHTLDVPGARLYYEVQGSGPALVLVGHPLGASGFARIAPLLAQTHTVVTFDPRGFARSAIEDPDQDAEPDLLADDVRRVLEDVGQVPAQVFGSSGGAITGLALVARYPGHVETLIAHEPPLALLLPDAEKARTGIEEIYDTYRQRGTSAAWEKFASFTGLTMRPQGGNVRSQRPSAEADATGERFFGHGLLPIALYQPDFPALQAATAPVIVAGGTTSRGEFAQRSAAALAERLGTPLIDCPGGHGGPMSDPEAFADVMRRLLA
jgi:clorobiocin biosynthesis protein CloN7